MGTGLVIAVYAGLNLVYFRVLTLSEIAASPRVAADAARRLVGPWGSQLTAVAIVVAVFGSLNGSILAGARVYYAMAKDGLFFRWCAAVHPRFRTPHLSLVVQGLWSCLLVLLADYEQLFTYTVFAAWIFYALTALAVIILRRTRPELPRPYRVPGYPVVPVVFVLTAAAFVLNMLAEMGIESVKLPPRSPNLNAYAERFVRTIKESCLEQMILFGEDSLRDSIHQFLDHYHLERNHQSLDNRLIIPMKGKVNMKGRIDRRARLGGLLNYYYRRAA